eukprot:TRINITY_DN12843_c0_g1_i1.p1 TRINITY_DN12843_c0_g1~~TRINITY_DN12843_c0_g1_i1.p1  ORF type:complete len:200 (-),score=32.94 TRINITY_DN12843_c0_g1_i1:335-910(-)
MAAANKAADIAKLNQFGDDQFLQLLEPISQFLIDGNATAFLERVGDFAATLGANPNAVRNLAKSLVSVLRVLVRSNATSTTVQETLNSNGLDADKAATVGSMWAQNTTAYSVSQISQTLAVNELLDMEWSFGVTASTSELQQAGVTYLRLKLVLDKGTQKENVYLELPLAQFFQFLHEMEKVKVTLDALSA